MPNDLFLALLFLAFTRVQHTTWGLASCKNNSSETHGTDKHSKLKCRFVLTETMLIRA